MMFSANATQLSRLFPRLLDFAFTHSKAVPPFIDKRTEQGPNLCCLCGHFVERYFLDPVRGFAFASPFHPHNLNKLTMTDGRRQKAASGGLPFSLPSPASVFRHQRRRRRSCVTPPPPLSRRLPTLISAAAGWKRKGSRMKTIESYPYLYGKRLRQLDKALIHCINLERISAQTEVRFHCVKFSVMSSEVLCLWPAWELSHSLLL